MGHYSTKLLRLPCSPVLTFPELSSSCKAETLYPWHHTSLTSAQCLAATVLLSWLNCINHSNDPDGWTGTVFGICDSLSWQTSVCSKFLHVVACVEVSFLTFLLSLLMVLEIEFRAFLTPGKSSDMEPHPWARFPSFKKLNNILLYCVHQQALGCLS